MRRANAKDWPTRPYAMVLTAVVLIAAIPVAGQACDDQTGVTTEQVGHTASSSVGSVGQRQTRDTVAGSIRPTARLNSRITSRIQSRLLTRIDRNYSAEADPTRSIKAAEDTLRASSRPR
jgi:hypothetical protein